MCSAMCSQRQQLEVIWEARGEERGGGREREEGRDRGQRVGCWVEHKKMRGKKIMHCKPKMEGEGREEGGRGEWEGGGGRRRRGRREGAASLLLTLTSRTSSKVSIIPGTQRGVKV